IGLPIRLTLGNRSLKEGKVEMKLRSDLSQSYMFDLDKLVPEVLACIQNLREPLEVKEPDYKII
ncbi:MAG: proline--tRNA ligase, partial [Sphaerochaetaceae bacterium]|nr:proline--tRNA ligase [Sphaerochaetaceae bacterium]